jgi:hypothetical protein
VAAVAAAPERPDQRFDPPPRHQDQGDEEGDEADDADPGGEDDRDGGD